MRCLRPALLFFFALGACCVLRAERPSADASTCADSRLEPSKRFVEILLKADEAAGEEFLAKLEEAKGILQDVAEHARDDQCEARLVQFLRTLEPSLGVIQDRLLRRTEFIRRNLGSSKQLVRSHKERGRELYPEVLLVFSRRSHGYQVDLPAIRLYLAEDPGWLTRFEASWEKAKAKAYVDEEAFMLSLKKVLAWAQERQRLSLLTEGHLQRFERLQKLVSWFRAWVKNLVALDEAEHVAPLAEL